MTNVPQPSDDRSDGHPMSGERPAGEDPVALRPPAAGILLDERGTRCPQPIIALGIAAADAPAGSRIALLADDPAALSDVPAWCRMKGATLVEATDLSDGSGTRFDVVLNP